MTDNNTNNNALPPDPRPYWMPGDADFEKLPDGVKAAMEGIIGPGYRELVMGAPNALERLAGMSLVHLVHIEVLDQVDLGRNLAAAEPTDREKRMAGHVRLVGAKLRAASFVHRLRQARGRMGSADGKATR